jgi:hypothetical protein
MDKAMAEELESKHAALHALIEEEHTRTKTFSTASRKRNSDSRTSWPAT